MANIASQRKRNARSLREHDENRLFKSAVRTHFRRLETAIAEGDENAVESEHRELISRIDKAVQKGALHRRSGARKKARAARIRAASSS